MYTFTPLYFGGRYCTFTLLPLFDNFVFEVLCGLHAVSEPKLCFFFYYFIIFFLLYFFGSQIKNKEFDLKKRTQKNVICQVDNGLTHSIQYIKYILENISIYSLLVLVLLILKILGINYITF